MEKKLVLIDGHSILNRAFYGVPDLSNSEGLHTNAIYGFLNIMFKIIEEEQPDYLAVAFDVKAPTFRHKLYADYKGTRKSMPEELHQQVPVMKELLTAMGILIMEQPGLEADDILGTFAKRAEAGGAKVALVSGDRDLLQIATQRIKIRIPRTKGGRTEIEDYFAEDVQRVYQVTPSQFIDLKALMGDASDNIPGVPRVGEKTATQLMVAYGSLDNIYAHVEEISKKSIRESLMENENLARLSRTLAAIDVDGQIPYTLEDAKYGDPFTKEAYIICRRLEFKNFLSRFEQDDVSADAGKDSFRYVTGLKEAEDVFETAGNRQEAAFFILEDSPAQEDFAALALALSEDQVYVFAAEGFLTKSYLTDRLAGLYGKCRLITCGIKGQYEYLKAEEYRQTFDILIAAYLLNPLKNDYTAADIAGEHLDLMIPEASRLFGKEPLCKALEEKREAFLEYAGFLVYTAYRAAPVLWEKLHRTGMERLFTQIEMPLSYVLYSMEKEGVRVNKPALMEYGSRLAVRMQELEEEIYGKARVRFNINSPKQLGEILFEKMGLPGGKKTKTGYSTAADVLEKLSGEYDIVKDILEYRTVAKLKSTYADGLAACIGEDGKIHTTFNQTITATGRISSTDPNLQNIPMRMELGRLIRKVFVPGEGRLFVDADYSQIELRLLAHMSGDEQLIASYQSDADIHKITASKVFHIPMEEVTSLQRRNAKAVNFGIVYGISSFGLSQDLSITRKEAAAYIEQYFATYPKVKGFLDGLVAEGKEKGYVTTLFGRRRPIPELSSANFMQRSFGERVAMNSPLQGTAADIMKIAMIRVFDRLRREGLRTRLLLQVHDELLVETLPEEEQTVRRILEEEMKGAASLKVTLETDIHSGGDWYEAK